MNYKGRLGLIKLMFFRKVPKYFVANFLKCQLIARKHATVLAKMKVVKGGFGCLEKIKKSSGLEPPAR